MLRALGRLAEALDAYQRALALQPAYAEAQYNLGNTLYALGRREDALLAYDRAVKLKPDDANAQLNCANTLKDLGQLQQALQGYEPACNSRRSPSLRKPTAPMCCSASASLRPPWPPSSRC